MAPFPLQVGKAVGSEGLVAGQVVDIKSEGKGEVVGLDTLQVGPGLGRAGRGGAGLAAAGPQSCGPERPAGAVACCRRRLPRPAS